jgi:molybdopterin/thiamine biosynthesis adenylyltransferase
MDHTRHIGIFDCSMETVTLIGAGGIGALTAVVLAKMGVAEISVCDDDKVDSYNLATQFFRIDDLNKCKVHQIKQIIRQFSDETNVMSMLERVTPHTDIPTYASIVISAVDSIQARQDIWQALSKVKTWNWYLDARMGAEIFHLYCVNKNNCNWYSNALMSVCEDDVEEEPCTSKATIYTASIAAGQIGMAVRDIVTGGMPPPLLVHNIRNRVLMVV